MDDFTKLASLGALLERARTCLSSEDLPQLVMSDPGHPGYVAAYERVLAGGAPELLRDGGLLLNSFEITENLLLSHSEASTSPRHRWFSILTACIELLSWNGWEASRGTPASQALCNLTTDSFALLDAGDARAPLELLPSTCRELQQASENRHLRATALLCELLVGDLTDADIETRCRELNRHHDAFQAQCVESEDTNEWIPNVWLARRPEFIWGAAVSQRQELRMWLELVKAHFPWSPGLALKTRERLLEDGEAWERSARRR
ncbi:hypothetical protein [Pyxidicoccus xibeiensis]|uniref:hypothetical protein n=1 Tax=Pyxidicoccus xibeiensis TaxID=2906759 RepID=UPI0020A7FAFD|nr:hypothetical protein [Pyxidicoccus xibeiensis]MCP3139441.1 hypothetical protein [Pyxidicoccus xibeiensis]